MRLLIVTADYPPQNWSGIGVAVQRQADALAALGIEVHVLVPFQPGAADSRRRAPGAPVLHYLSRHRCPVGPEGFDLVHLHSLSLGEFCLQMCRRYRLPLVYTAHSLVHLELGGEPRAAPWQALQQQLMAASTRVIFLSRSELTAAEEMMAGLGAHGVVIPNGIRPGRRLPPAVAGGPVVFAGRFARSKGMELLGDLIPDVIERSPLRFVLAGGHGDATGDRVIHRLQSRLSPDRCHVCGWLAADRVERLLAGARLVLVPSLYEPFGLVAVEAMAAGVPVLAAAVGGLVELVPPQGGNRLISSRDPRRWAQAVLEMTVQPTQPSHLREQNRRYVISHFDIADVARRLVADVYLPSLQQEGTFGWHFTGHGIDCLV